MRFALAALFLFAILTLWVPAEWPVTVFELGVFLLAVLALVRGLPPYSWPLIPLAAAPCWALVQLLFHITADPFQTAAAAVRFAAFLATYISAIHVFRHRESRRWFRTAMLWFAFLVAILATVQSFTAHGRVFWLFPTGVTDYLMGPFLSRNHYAAFTLAVLPCALYQALRGRGNATLYSLMAAVMYASVVASASRAGTVLATGEVVAVVLLMLVRGRTSGHAAGTSLLQMVAVIAVFCAVVGPGVAFNRLGESDPLAIRRELNVASVHMIAAHPWIGVGLGAWPSVYGAYAIVDVGAFVNQAHNDWLQWAAEGGIPFALLMVTLFIWSIRPAVRSVWGIGILAVFLQAAVDYPFSRPALGGWTVLILAMLASRAAEKKLA